MERMGQVFLGEAGNVWNKMKMLEQHNKAQPREESGCYSTDVFRSSSCLDRPPNYPIFLNFLAVNPPASLNE